MCEDRSNDQNGAWLASRRARMPGGCPDMPGVLIGPLRANGGPSANPQVRAPPALRSSSFKGIWLRRGDGWLSGVDSGRTLVHVAVKARDRAAAGGVSPVAR